MIANVYSYEKLIETYPEDKFILEVLNNSESGLYQVYSDPRYHSSGKVILKIIPVKIIK